jgi:capsular polysaccharide biosynthesis protein
MLSIPEEKLINCIEDINFHLIADTVYVPSYPNEHGTVNQWVCSEVKALYKTIASGANDCNNKRLYISRKKAVGRKLINEDVLVDHLQQVYGFVKVFTEDFSMAEKVRMFQQAECIVAPHGGGMTNILFCEAGCKIVDIFPPGDFDTFFWSISNSNKLEYYYFFGKGELPTAENDFVKRNVDIDVDMEKFKDLMNLLKLQKIK